MQQIYNHSKFIIVLIMLFTASMFPQKWTVKQIPDTSVMNPNIAVDSQGVPHFVFMTRVRVPMIPNFELIKHAVFESDSFTIEIADTGNTDEWASISLDQNDRPHFGYHNHPDWSLIHTYHDGLDWQSEIIFSEGHDGWSSSIAFDDLNNPHISFVDPACCSPGGLGIEYAYFDGNQWNVEIIGSEPFIWIQDATALVLDSDGNPHITYYDMPANRLMIAQKDSSWTFTAIDTNKNPGRFSSMVIDENDFLSVAYLDSVAFRRATIKLARFNGQQWKIIPIDELFDVILYPEMQAHSLVDLARDPAGVFHVVYADQKNLKYASILNNEVNIETIINFSDTNRFLSQTTAIDVDTAGLPHVTFEEVETNAGNNSLNLGYYATKKMFDINFLSSFETISPGDTINIVFEVTNNSILSFSPDVKIDLILPDSSFRSFLNPKSISLSPRGTAVQSTSFSLPPGAPLGIYKFIAHVGESIDTDTLEVLADSLSYQNIEMIPDKNELLSNYPNPFNSSTVISFSINIDGRIELIIYDVIGRRIRALIAGFQKSGVYHVSWDGRNEKGFLVDSGVYFFSLKTERSYHVRKMLMVK